MAVKKLTKNEAISVCYACMVLADGKVDQAEIDWQAASPIAQKYEVDKNRAMIADHLENGTFKNLVKQLPTPTLKKMSIKERNQIASDIMLLGAVDGDVHENEAKMLMPIYITLGGTVEQFQAFWEKMMEEDGTKSSGRRSANPRSVSSDSGGGCFVATATMGNYNHPVVLDLRKYRDEVLRKSIAGNIFIKIYYSVGPIFAYLIDKNNFLKRFSYKFLIKPLHKLVTNK